MSDIIKILFETIKDEKEEQTIGGMRYVLLKKSSWIDVENCVDALLETVAELEARIAELKRLEAKVKELEENNRQLIDEVSDLRSY